VNPFFLVAALADLTGVVVHGYVGHRLLLTPMTPDRLFTTRAFGDADMSRRILVVTWHAVTVAFATSALMMAVWGFGSVSGDSGPLFVSVMHAGILVLGLGVSVRRVRGIWRRPIPVAFVTCMATVVLMGLLGSR
jgi:hypothetical protein